MVFAAPTSPLARGPVTLEQLAAAPWILRERGSGTREIVDYLLLSHLPKFEMAMELGTPRQSNMRCVMGWELVACRDG